jgi:hypothetical protein
MSHTKVNNMISLNLEGAFRFLVKKTNNIIKSLKWFSMIIYFYF